MCPLHPIPGLCVQSSRDCCDTSLWYMGKTFASDQAGKNQNVQQPSPSTNNTSEQRCLCGGLNSRAACDPVPP